jgi:hypothetical protein
MAMIPTTNDDQTIRSLTDVERQRQTHEIDQIVQGMIAIGVADGQIFQVRFLQAPLSPANDRVSFASVVSRIDHVEGLPVLLPTGILQFLHNWITPDITIDD